MLTYMLDTDMASYVIKGHSTGVEARFRSLPTSSVCISVVTRAELLYGLKRLPPSHRLHLLVRHFLRIVRVLPWEENASDWYAEIRHQLTSSGKPIGEMDMMIASHALAQNAILVTNNFRHYRQIEAPLTLENWL